MNKKYIIKDTREFSSILNKRDRIQNSIFVIYKSIKKEEQNRFGISTPKKIGNAVTRNKLRRQTKEIIRKDENNFELAMDCIIIVKKAALELNFEELSKNLNMLLTKIDK